MPIYIKSIALVAYPDLSMDGPGVIVRAARTGESQIVSDTRLDEDYVPALVENGGPSLSELAVPVKVDNAVFGVINVESPHLDDFDEEDRTLLETFAEQIASSILRIRRMDELEALVNEKTDELLNAERIVTAGRVASMVGHDLRGPLQTIKNASYLMKKTPGSKENLIDLLDGAVDYAATMLEELRLDTVDTPLQAQEVNLGALIRRAVVEASSPASVDMELHIGDGLESVSLDPMRIRRVLGNLIRNAVEAMPDGGKLMVSSERLNHHALIRVADTGVGIPEEDLLNLFNVFHTTKPGGIGLGLAYCKRAVEAHGGTIRVESNVGEGTTFTVRLPI